VPRLSDPRTHMAKLNRLAAVATLTVGSLRCDPYVKVTGTVREPSGAPLAGVLVTLATAGRESRWDTTGGDGRFHVGLVGADPRLTSITFDHVGYQHIQRMVGEEEQQAIDVTLLPR
jgi:hypothetical protein